MASIGSALITGAAGGIGRELCVAFSRAGYHVVGSDVAAENIEADVVVEADLLELCCSNEYRARTVSRMRGAVSDAGIAVLVNNAAVQILGCIGDISATDFETTYRVNVMAPLVLTRELLPQIELGGGSVINIASVHAEQTKPGFVSYATSKAAVVGLTKALAVDLGGRVRVNVISPAATATRMLLAGFEGNAQGLADLGEMHPIGRIADPSDVASAAVFLASESASSISGACLSVDGGISVRLRDPN